MAANSTPMDSQTSSDNNRLPLDPNLYILGEPELEFFSAETGISDREELRRHIFTVQEEAYKVHPYHCIRAFSFARLKISRFPAYKDLLKIGKERKGALFLDLGCCVGNDVRKAVADGFPISQAIAADLHPEFWELGHNLFKSTPETFPVPFIQADLFDPASLAPAPLPTSVPSAPLAPLSTLTSLNPLHGRLSVIHISSVFHLFSEERQFELAKLIAPLLSPEPGSFIFGCQGGLPQKGERTRKNSHGLYMVCHSPESWKELWEKQIFPEGQVKVDAFLHEFARKDWGLTSDGEVPKSHMLVWSITRL